MQWLFQWLLRTSVQASVLIILVALAQWLFRPWLSPRWRYCLWWLVLIRLMMPVSWESGLSLFNANHYAMASLEQIDLQQWLPLHLGGGRKLASVSASPHENASASHSAVSEDRPDAKTSSGDTVTLQSATVSTPEFSPQHQPASSEIPLFYGVVWLAGALFLGLRILVQNFRFWRRLRRQPLVTDAGVRQLLAECQEVMSLRSSLKLMETAAVTSPALYGLFRKSLLLPAGMLDRFNRKELRYVFLHELAHLKRHDLPANWLMTLLQILHWFNPLVWLAFRRIAADRESACDERVLSSESDVEKQEYGQTIIKLLEGFAHPAAMPGMLGLLEDRIQMERRIRMIANFQKTNRWSLVAVTLLLALGLVTLTDAQNKTDVRQSGSPSDANDVNESKTGLKFAVVKMTAARNDTPKRRFLLYGDLVIPSDGSQSFKLKELKGTEIAAWSPDGRKIAFNSRGLGVLPVSPETGRPAGAIRKLLEEPENWFRGKIYWSADSEQILFVKWNGKMERDSGSFNLGDGRLNKHPNYADFGVRSPEGSMTAYSVPQDGIWVRPASGGSSRVLRGGTGGWLYDDPVAWSANGEWVASVVNASGWKYDEIHITRLADGIKFDVLPPEEAGIFIGPSSDAKKLLFYRSSSNIKAVVKIVPCLGGPANSVGQSADFEDLENLFWTPDSTALTVLGIARERPLFWTFAVEGGKHVQFNLNSLGQDGAYAWLLSPDSQKLLYLAWPAGHREPTEVNFYSIPISTKTGKPNGAATLVFKGWQNPIPSVAMKLGAWSPDSTKIVLPQKGEKKGDLWIAYADGRQPVQITQTPDELEQNPKWSRDGTMIAFNLDAGDSGKLQVIPASGGATKTLLTTPKGQLSPFGWSPNSKEVVAVTDRAISSYSIDDGSSRELARLKDLDCESVAWLDWAPNGKRLAFYGEKGGEAGRLFLFFPGTGKCLKLDNCPGMASAFSWSPDSSSISCFAVESDPRRPADVLRELDLAAAIKKAPAVAEKKPVVTNAIPQVAPIAGPIFKDDFDNGLSKQWRFQDFPDKGMPPRHSVENGHLVLSHSRAILDGVDWTNYVVKVRACLKEALPSDIANFGIVTRATPIMLGSGLMDRYSLSIFCINKVPRYVWQGINYNDVSNKLLHGYLGRSACSIVQDKWFTLEFEVRDQELRGYLDGKLATESTDGRLLKGGVWLNCTDTRVLFDDFSVRQLP
jgi:beta-lactamase regulating signal transducer with metallopeptidase domain/Tol biopolymer transport system component